MDSSDLSAFSLGLDTPSKFLNGAPTGLTPAPWSMGTGLTPSLLGGFSGSGWTPSLTAVAGSKGELNPFEISLSNSSKRRAAAAGVDFPLDRDDAAARGYGTSGLGDNMFDFLATTPGSAGGGRKRALSSPAVEMGAGSASFPFLAQPPPSHHGTAIANDGVQRLKRPRMAPVQASSLTSQDPLFSTFERGESDESPASSVVLTPPDTAPLYKPDGKSSEKVPPSAEKVDIAVSASPTAPHLPAHVPPAAAPPLHVTQPFSALSRLAQERSALIAGGRGILSQSQPLPMKQPGSSFALPQAVPAPAPVAPESAAADISVKAEPGEEQQDLAASTSRAESHAPRPPVTRGQSKRGTRSSLALGSASSSTGVSPAPAATPSGPKRKASRKKSTAASTRREKTKEPSLAPLEGEGDDEEGEGSGKRQQFLERNRVAACKSRQKKKEKVAGLEQFAADLCARNHMLQQTALSLRQEALALRQLVHAHVGCSCEHAHGYIARDAAGGGIATIDQLAGRTLNLDYSVPPAMGTDDDVYSFLDQGDVPLGPTTNPDRTKSVGSVATGPAIPIVARPAPAQPASLSGASVSPVRRDGMMTRRSSQAVRSSYGQMNGHDAEFRAAVKNNHLGYPMDGMPLEMHDAGAHAAHGLRASSAPPTTPGWGEAAPTGDYFAPKPRRATAICA